MLLELRHEARRYKLIVIHLYQCLPWIHVSIQDLGYAGYVRAPLDACIALSVDIPTPYRVSPTTNLRDPSKFRPLPKLVLDDTADRW